MKKIFLLLSLTLLSCSVFSQGNPTRIKISDDIELIKLSDNAYIHVSYSVVTGYGRTGANGLIFINDGDAFLFDTPWNDTQTETLVTYLKEKMHLQVKGFIPNHWHEDCMGGLAYLIKAGIPTYANQKTIDIARQKHLPVAEHGFSDSLMLMSGNREIHCYFLGAAHSTDNVVVWIPSENILFPGCMVKSMNATNLGNTADGNLAEYPKTIQSVIKKFRGAKIVIPGHGDFGGPELLSHTLSLTQKQ